MKQTVAPDRQRIVEMLQRVGKHARHVKLKELKDVKKTALRYYVRQALKFDKE